MRLQISLSGSDGNIIEGGIYASVKPIGTCAVKLKAMLDVIEEYSPNRDKLHCTILYSLNKNKVNAQPHTERVHAANIMDFTHWKGKDGTLYLVARLESPSLHRAFRGWSDLGYSSDFTDYRPHITIKKGLTKEEAVRAADLLTLEYFKKPFILTFGPQKIEPLRD